MRIGKRKLAALCAGKVVELEKGDYRQRKFYDLDIGGEEPLRIWVVKVRGDKALVRLNQEPPLEYLAADSSRGYTAWQPVALGRNATRTSTSTGHWDEPEPPVVYRDVLEAQTKESKATWEVYRQVARPNEVAAERQRRLVNKLRKIEREASKAGVDLTQTLEDAVQASRVKLLNEKERAA